MSLSFREVADDLSVELNLGLVDIEARKHVRGIANATEPYQGVFPPLHSKVVKSHDPQILLGSPSWLEPTLDDFPAATR